MCRRPDIGEKGGGGLGTIPEGKKGGGETIPSDVRGEQKGFVFMLEKERNSRKKKEKRHQRSLPVEEIRDDVTERREAASSRRSSERKKRGKKRIISIGEKKGK